MLWHQQAQCGAEANPVELVHPSVARKVSTKPVPPPKPKKPNRDYKHTGIHDLYTCT